MNNNILILLDTFVGVFLIPAGLIINVLNKCILQFVRPKPRGRLLIKLLGAGNYLSLKSKLNAEPFDILTVRSNLKTLKHFGIGNRIYLINDKNIFLLFISSFSIFFKLLLQNYEQVINLEMESKFAKFLSLISPTKSLSGISSHNKSYLDCYIYDSYLVSPLLMGRGEIVSQLISFKPETNNYHLALVRSHQEKFKKKFLLNKSLQHVGIFPGCSSTDPLRRLKERDWRLILSYLIKNKNVKNITIIFSSKKDPQYKFFQDILMSHQKDKLNLKITNFKDFVHWVKKSDLILSVDSQALHIAQLYKKESIVFYGPTSPFGINLEETTYPVSLSLSCSPCTHKYLRLPCNNIAPCMNFNKKHLDIFNI